MSLAVVAGETAPDARLPIFCRAAFGRLHGAAEAFSLQLVDESSGEAVGGCRFARDDVGIWRSPLRGSFGGLGLTEAGIPGSEALLVEAERRLAGEARVTLAPIGYAPEVGPRELNLFLGRGWAVARHELTQAIPVGPGEFAAIVRKEKRRKLNLCRREGVTARRLAAAELAAAYDVMVENRAKRGYPLSMAWPDLERMGEAFPDDVIGFGAEREGRLIAAAICIRVDARVLYAFYYGDRPGHETLNPVLPVLEAAYEHWRAAGGVALDLGASTLDGVPNDSLLAFKRSLGAELSVKFWLAKSF